MIKSWDFKKHTVACVIISILIGIIAFHIINPTSIGPSSMGIIESTDGSGITAIYIKNDFYKVVLIGTIAFIFTILSYKFIRKEE